MDSQDYTGLEELLERPATSKISKYFNCFHWNAKKIHSDNYDAKDTLKNTKPTMVTLPASVKRKYRVTFSHN